MKTYGPLNVNEFRCAQCGGIDEKGPEGVAMAEKEKYWGDVPLEECVVVCDDCWNAMHPDTHSEKYQATLRELGK